MPYQSTIRQKAGLATYSTSMYQHTYVSKYLWIVCYYVGILRGELLATWCSLNQRSKSLSSKLRLLYSFFFFVKMVTTMSHLPDATCLSVQPHPASVKQTSFFLIYLNTGFEFLSAGLQGVKSTSGSFPLILALPTNCFHLFPNEPMLLRPQGCLMVESFFGCDTLCNYHSLNQQFKSVLQELSTI